MRSKTETISFRADLDLLRLIDKQREHFAISRGSWVRGIVITWLNQIDVPQTDSLNEDQLKIITDSLARIYLGLAKSTYLNLTRVGQISKEDARELVREHLGKE